MTNTDSEEQPLLGGFAQSNRTVRSSLKRFLESKTGHYAVLILVSLDVSSIFVGFILQLLVCDGNLSPKDGSQGSEVLSVISLVFSSLFMLELVVSIYAFGRVYFQSWFHCFDATVILASFVIDITLRGIDGEIYSLVIILRMWRVFKIIEELSAGAEENTKSLYEEIDELKSQNQSLQHQLDSIRQRRA